MSTFDEIPEVQSKHFRQHSTVRYGTGASKGVSKDLDGNTPHERRNTTPCGVIQVQSKNDIGHCLYKTSEKLYIFFKICISRIINRRFPFKSLYTENVSRKIGKKLLEGYMVSIQPMNTVKETEYGLYAQMEFI